MPDGHESPKASTLAAAENAGLQMAVNARGLISASVDASGSLTRDGELTVGKPAGATVREAYLAYATTGFTNTALAEPLLLAGHEVPLTQQVATGIDSYNYFADVTDLVAPLVDAAPAGDVTVPVTEPQTDLTDGEVLVVVFDDPAVTAPRSVTVQYGAVSPAGDTYAVHLASPIDLADPQTHLEMSLGISFGYQDAGTPQYSQVDVNGQPLTSAAGGRDDGADGNGALITAGGVGDSADNPSDPDALPVTNRSDDELYDLRPFVTTGATDITVSTANPSRDDNVFLAVFEMNPPVTEIDTGTGDVSPATQTVPVGGDFTVSAYGGSLLFPGAFATVVEGPNSGATISGGCSSPCGPVSTTWHMRGPTDFSRGLDTLVLWIDENFDGNRDPSEQLGTFQIEWTKAIDAVAMGDSYSSGEGVDPYDPGTDDDWGDDRNQCHRSAHAFGRVQQPPGYTDSIATYLDGPTETTLAFIACAGATTHNVRLGGAAQYTEPGTQLEQGRTSPDTDLVTLTIGGNDVGFTDILTACSVPPSCVDPGANQVNGMAPMDWASAALTRVGGRLDALLPQVEQSAPDATVVLLGYPRLFTVGAGCVSLNLWDDAERAWLNDMAVSLDGVMRAAAARAGVHFVSVLDAFEGHATCGPEGSWINGPTASNPFDWFNGSYVGTGSFHPNMQGQAAYAAALRAHLLEDLQTMPATRAGLPVNPAPTASLTAPSAADTDSGSTSDPGELGALAVLPADGDASSTCLPEGLVQAGALTRFAGEGFEPGSTVRLTWRTDSGGASLGTVTADAKGRVATELINLGGNPDSYALATANGTTPRGTRIALVGLVGLARSCHTPAYDFTGFEAPVHNAPTVNEVKAGRAIPIKFSLDADHGTDIFTNGSPTSRRVACDTGTPADEVEATTTANESGLIHAEGSTSYQYVWKTQTQWAGTCRIFKLGLKDGSTHMLTFHFR